MEEKVMTNLLAQATEVLTWVITSIGEFCELVMGQPILLIGIVCLLIGFCLSLVRKIISVY